MDYFCKTCGKKLINRLKRNGKIYLYAPRTKSGLCISCAAKVKYKKRGAFTSGKLFTEKEIILIKRLYLTKLSKEIGIILNRTESSIQHKANRLGLHKSKEFYSIHPKMKRRLFSSKNNPIYKEGIKAKIKKIKRERFDSGRIKLGGIALKSSLGLTKKENHPNWKGGISFEPYDSNFDVDFCEIIRERDKRICFICGKTEEKELEKINQRLCIHHIDYNKKNTIEKNCVSLCNSCHAKTHYRRIEWVLFFRLKMIERYNYEYNPQLKLVKGL